jgi:hypothetical protein
MDVNPKMSLPGGRSCFKKEKNIQLMPLMRHAAEN